MTDRLTNPAEREVHNMTNPTDRESHGNMPNSTENETHDRQTEKPNRA